MPASVGPSTSLYAQAAMAGGGGAGASSCPPQAVASANVATEVTQASLTYLLMASPTESCLTSYHGPVTKHRSRIDPRRAIVRVAISLAAGTAGYVLACSRLPGHAAGLVGWNTGALCLLALTWAVIVPADAPRTRHLAGNEDPGRTLVYVIALVASASSLVAATILVGEAHKLGPELARIVAGLCLLAVATSWTMTNTAFAMRYARLYYREDAEGIGGLELPGKLPPTYFDFAYVAFTVGMCFQVSDVCVTSRQIRRTVLLHAVISFGYNTVILAFVLNLVFGVAA
jgi:uncharacterized membrane protein